MCLMEMLSAPTLNQFIGVASGCNYEWERGELLGKGGNMRQAGNTSRGITRHIHNTSILGLSSVAVVIMNLDHGDERRRGAFCAG